MSDVKDREGSLSKSLMPNPFAGKAEKQFKETGALMKSLYPTVLYKWVFVNLRPSWKSNLQTAINNSGGRSKHKMMIVRAPAAAGGGNPSSTAAAQRQHSGSTAAA